MYSSSAHNYLKAIYGLQQQQRPVPNSALKARLGASASAVTEMTQHLAQLRLVRYVPYHGVELTAAGERLAWTLLRHHRVLEAFLYRELRVPWAEVHAEASRWEHALSPRLADRMAARLAEPLVTPYGARIPASPLDIPTSSGICLSDAPPRRALHVVEVDDVSSDMLRRCARLGLLPGRLCRVSVSAPDAGQLPIEIGGVRHLLEARTAGAIRVRLG